MNLTRATEAQVKELASSDAELDAGSKGDHRKYARELAIKYVFTAKMENVYVDEYVRKMEAGET